MSGILYLDTTTRLLMLGFSSGNTHTLEALPVSPDMEADERLISRCIETDSHRYHSALLAPAIQDLLAEAGVSMRALSALAVNVGPGSFTGIRTGVATARTMAQCLDVPVHTFNTFELLASVLTEPAAPIELSLEALRGRAYRAVLRFSADGPVYLIEPRLETGPSGIGGGMSEAEAAMIMLENSGTGTVTARKITAIPEGWDSVAAMHRLIRRYGQRFARPWQAVRPLYLQEPSITLGKK